MHSPPGRAVGSRSPPAAVAAPIGMAAAAGGFVLAGCVCVVLLLSADHLGSQRAAQGALFCCWRMRSSSARMCDLAQLHRMVACCLLRSCAYLFDMRLLGGVASGVLLRRVPALLWCIHRYLYTRWLCCGQQLHSWVAGWQEDHLIGSPQSLFCSCTLDACITLNEMRTPLLRRSCLWLCALLLPGGWLGWGSLVGDHVGAMSCEGVLMQMRVGNGHLKLAGSAWQLQATSQHSMCVAAAYLVLSFRACLR